MTRLLLIRHAHCAHVGRTLAGRSPGVALDERGRAEAQALSRLLSDAPLAAIAASPLERALQTAAPLATAHGVQVDVREAFHEIDFGVWTGRDFQELDGRPEWTRWNEARGSARAPGGEAATEVLDRALDGVRALAAEHRSGAWVAVVTHCDVIRTLLTHFLGMPLDRLLRLEIATASVSTVAIDPWGTHVLEVNRAADPPWRSAPGSVARARRSDVDAAADD